MTTTIPTVQVPAPPALRVREAAAYLGVSVNAMRKFREKGSGPQGRLAGGLLYYPIAELDRWMLGDFADNTDRALVSA